MSFRKINKRTFFKTLGVLAILGIVFPWFNKRKDSQLERDYPLDAHKDPNAIERPKGLI